MKRKLIGIGLVMATIAASLIFPDRLKFIMNDIMTGGPSLFSALGSISMLVGIWLLGGDSITPSENDIYVQEQNEEEERSVKPFMSRILYGSAEFDDAPE
jgi:hypothetical protein